MKYTVSLQWQLTKWHIRALEEANSQQLFQRELNFQLVSYDTSPKTVRFDAWLQSTKNSAENGLS